MITLNIDVKKLDKTLFFEGKENKEGHKPLYCNLVLKELKTAGKWGQTHFVIQDAGKDNRGKKMPIIGNAKERKPSSYQQAQADHAPKQSQESWNQQPASDEDVPF